LNAKTVEALKCLRRRLPEALEHLGIRDEEALIAWQRALDQKLLPRLDPGFPLLAAICGGGSAGKSSLFNGLVGRAISPTGGRAGLNRRVLAAVRPEHLAATDIMAALRLAFEGTPRKLTDPQELLTPGEPLLFDGSAAPGKVVLLDTPDIDTGAQGHYTNRDMAARALSAADLFIYIFTNATYNNKDNTDFIAGALTAIGTRPCFLVYRVYPSYPDAEVLEHVHCVARNIYGSDFHSHILGIFRADEENAVAAGSRTMQLRSLGSIRESLIDSLAALDPYNLRGEILNSTMIDVIGRAEDYLEKITAARRELDEYLQLLHAACRDAARLALSHLPTDRVLRRFADIWIKSDPTHIKILRRTGQVVEWPLKQLIKTVGRMTSRGPAGHDRSDEPHSAEKQAEVDLLSAANRLYRTVLDDRIDGEGRTAKIHSAVLQAQAALRDRDWPTLLNTILDKKHCFLSWASELDGKLRSLADDQRRRMGLKDQIRQTFAALLNIVPATAAITYVLHTGDPVGAAGIKIKLTGLFGLKDLYALIAIPITSGMTQADRNQLESMLGPVAREWLAHQLQAAEKLFESHITGTLADAAQAALRDSEAATGELSAAMEQLKMTSDTAQAIS
jgi:hypothetical protein